MMKDFLKFGFYSPKYIAKITFVSILIGIITKYTHVFFPQLYNPFYRFGSVLLILNHVIELCVLIIYIRVLCEFIYYIFAALKKYIES